MKKLRTIYLAGGCFWGLEKFMENITGVVETRVGYANGSKEKPTYKEVCTGRTGFAETVKVVYDPGVISLEALLIAFYNVIDPTSVNRQGPDVGSQYRSGIYYTDSEDLPVIEHVTTMTFRRLGGRKPLATEIKPLKNFYDAEEYHQKYLDKNPGGYCHIQNGKWDIHKIGSFGLPEKYRKTVRTWSSLSFFSASLFWKFK